MWNLFKRKIKKEIKQTEFVFETHEAVKIGDLYRYTVTADSREEAFKKLVQYFFGENMNQEVKSEHFETSYPNDSIFSYKNMPRWFAKRLGGHIKDKSCDYQKELEKYAIDNNIRLNLER